MVRGWYQYALPLSLSVLVFSCQSPAVPNNAAKPSMPSPTPQSSSKTFEEDVAFLSKHAPLKVLTSPSGGRIAVSGQYQARVMTSAVSAGAASLGFINRQFIEAGHTGTAFDNYGGEDRFWLGPEGGQYGLYFPTSKPFSFEFWQTPHELQEGAWQVRAESATSVSYAHAFSVVNYEQRVFKVEVERKLTVFSTEQASQRLGLPLPSSLSWVGFSSENKLTNTGAEPWQEASGLLSVWILGMFAPVPGTQVIVPFETAASGAIVNDAYFGKVPADRLLVNEQKGFLAFRADGQYRSKIGLGPTRAKRALGSYSEAAQLLTLVLYTKPSGATQYVNSMWERQAKPYAGDVINSYNDGPPAPGIPPLGGFYEIESSSPAAALAPGESLSHEHQTYHFSGPRAELETLARQVLGVSLSDLPH
ncbi:MAG TPA: DUF6786 family protein [Polyangiaceae bacterium]|nr:DUF6786 family protein [Polyangiaceae bacterium]